MLAARRTLLIAGAVIALGVVGLGGFGGAAKAQSVGGDLSGSDTCTPLQLTKVNGLRSDGSVVNQSSPGQAQLYVYQLSQGTVTQVVPPDGFSPLAATDQELATYGFPPRPTGAAELKQWTELYSHWTGSASPGMCRRSKSNLTGGPSANWAGLETTGRTYTTVTGQWTEPSWVFGCAHASSHSIWTGLGGDPAYGGTNHLLQSGVDTGGSNINSVYGWWEAISPVHDTYEVQFSGFAPRVGDVMSATTTYKTSGSPTGVNMSVYDASTGKSAATGYMNYIDGLSVVNYYSGSTADFINERPGGGSAPGGYYYLRKPGTTGLKTTWSAATANSTSVNSLSHIWDYMSDGNLLEDVGSGFLGTQVWTDHWDACV